ncbi:hypothetical protein SAY87_014415 [Trapa incisa]|uniref:Peptidase metallopeptidase domain-containing protein n=1 Tax=Trapa incisa TaxID=236973 RepID=A0AAN7GSK7_9MYRT|nr:hypothetical protein SAY87_014415 [Trapa incisa]
MAPSSKPTCSFSLVILLFTLVLSCTHCFAARKTPHAQLLDVKSPAGDHDFSKFTRAEFGRRVDGMSGLKRYLRRLEYLSPAPLSAPNLSNHFDDLMQPPVASYQNKLGLQATGRLDPEIISPGMSPGFRVGDHEPPLPSAFAGADHHHHIHVTEKYGFFEGQPKWEKPGKPMILTYALSPDHTIHSLSQADIRSAFAKAFGKWAEVIPVRFEETTNFTGADIRISFFSGFHGDADPFDGTTGTLVGHSMPPPFGELHLDAGDNWAVDFKDVRGLDPLTVSVMDLESVAIHEIGHVLGLVHSTDPESVMYPIIPSWTKQTKLGADDIRGIQTLYGAKQDSSSSFLGIPSRRSAAVMAIAVLAMMI